jgi:hypothetical protein
MTDALLIYPKLGTMDSLVADLPLSIIYAATESIKREYDIKCVDLRGQDGIDWKSTLKSHLDNGVLLVGLSVMTGSPIKCAKQVSLFVRENYPETKIVWGGPHVTLCPESLEEDFIDVLVRGYGSEPLANLIGHLKTGAEDFSDIPGVSFVKDQQCIHNPRPNNHEKIHYLDIPYDLVDVNGPDYLRKYKGERIFPIFSAVGCPYKCTFCVTPATYGPITAAPKWSPLANDEVVDHIEFITNKYGATHIVFIDDTSFPSIKRMRIIFNDIIRRDLNVRLEFRGARVNELKRMDDEFIQLMIKAGTRVLKVGAESGNNRLLKLFKKDCTREDIISQNRKFAKYSVITMDYNFFCGAPTETYYDLLETKDMVIQMIKDNPNAYYSYGADWKPIPGAQLLQIAEDTYGYKGPQTLDEWADMDSVDSKEKLVHPWYTRKHNNLIKMMQMAAFVIDKKIAKETIQNKSLPFMVLRLLSLLYKPIALFRLKTNFYELMVEYPMYRFAMQRVWPVLQRISGTSIENNAY